jgi:GT2 family glycosyltransferase
VSSPADVGVVVVNHRSAPDVERCLESLWPSIERGLRVVVVDNASGDDSVVRLNAYVAARAGDGPVVVVEAPNDGFGAGCNVGAAWFDALSDPPELLWFLNPDCEVEPGALDALLRVLDAQPDALCGALLVERADPDTVQCAGGFEYSPWTTRQRPLLAGTARDETLTPAAIESHIDFVAGASMTCRRQLFTDAGCFAPDYFLYFEEFDLARRIVARGGRLTFAPDAVVRHATGTSTGGKTSTRRRSSPVSEYHATLSALVFTRRYYPARLPVVMFVRLGFKVGQLLRFGQPQLILSVLAAYGAFARRLLVRR